MSVPALCARCGYRFTSRMFNFSNAVGITLSGCSEECPRCGGRADLQDGTYDFVGHAVAAFRAPGVSREGVARLRDIAQAVQAGAVSRDEATAQIEELAAPLAMLWKWTNENGGALSVLISIISLFLMIYYARGSDAVAAQQHRDAQQQIAATQSLREVQEKIHAELQKQTAAQTAKERPPRPKQPTPLTFPTRTPVKAVAPNRHERRKAAALARRRKP